MNNELDGNEDFGDTSGRSLGTEEEISVEAEARRIEMEKNNAEFLKQSWANIAQNEDEEARLLRELEQPNADVNDNDGFQLVKERSKAVKKKKQVVSNYGTRKKTGNPKHFK